VPSLHILKTLKPTELEILGNYYAGPHLTIKDDPSEDEEVSTPNTEDTMLLYGGDADNHKDEVMVHIYEEIQEGCRPHSSHPNTMPEEFYTVCHIPSDPLISMPKLPCAPTRLQAHSKVHAGEAREDGDQN
jgi:hypothetical protein